MFRIGVYIGLGGVARAGFRDTGGIGRIRAAIRSGNAVVAVVVVVVVVVVVFFCGVGGGGSDGGGGGGVGVVAVVVTAFVRMAVVIHLGGLEFR